MGHTELVAWAAPHSHIQAPRPSGNTHSQLQGLAADTHLHWAYLYSAGDPTASSETEFDFRPRPWGPGEPRTTACRGGSYVEGPPSPDTVELGSQAFSLLS